MKTLDIVIPYKPRPFQMLIHNDRTRYRVVVAHRGCGKTHLAINELIMSALRDRGVYAYIAPLKQQAKQVSWDHIKEYVSTIPALKFNEIELTITFPNKSKILLLGSGDPDSIRGNHFKGVVLDEVAQMPYTTWSEVVMPALQANGGWALFIGTPKGENLFFDLYKKGENGDKGWVSYMLDINTTGVFSPEQIEQIEADSAAFDQEYLCSFYANVGGAFYADTLTRMEQMGHIGEFPYNPALPVYTAWDLGLKDLTAIWFAQIMPDNGHIHIIDYYENKNQLASFYINEVRNRGYLYAYHILPHDAALTNMRSDVSFKSMMELSGMRCRMLPKTTSVIGDIGIVQGRLHACYFNEFTTRQGLVRLKEYTSKADRMTGTYLNEPLHDKRGNSDCADAFRYLILGAEPIQHGIDAKKVLDAKGGIRKNGSPMDRIKRTLRGTKKWR